MSTSPYLASFTPPRPVAAPTPEEFKEQLILADSASPEAVAFYSTIYHGAIPESIPGRLTDDDPSAADNIITAIILSKALQKRGYYGRATVTFAETVAAVLGKTPILDLMAGSGFMVKAFRQAGIPTIATDDYSWNFRGPGDKLDALTALSRYSAEVSTVLISWAPAASTIDLELWEAIQREHPHLGVLAIGEAVGGCTGSDAFATIREDGSWEEIPYATTSTLSDYCSYHPPLL